MATFSQGIELVSVTSVDTYGGAISYVVPSGHYAKVSFALTSVSTASCQLFIGSTAVINTASADPISGNITVTAGKSISIITSGASAEGYAGIEVYKNP